MKLTSAIFLLAGGLLLAACGDDDDQPKDSSDTGVPTDQADADGDGFNADVDCNDQDSDVHPDATELCDGIDNDCDDLIDEDLLLTGYLDSDGDSWGDPATAADVCPDTQGYVFQADDCNDSDPAIHPGADEYCNGVDDDCDDETDENPVDASLWYLDSDGDSWGDEEQPLASCDQPSGYVAEPGDCDDSSPEINPGADEYCNGVDDDCDDETDEDATDASLWYLDSDGDSWGDEDLTLASCDQPSGYVAEPGDCDDSSPEINPGATEICDELDNDCDDAVDEGLGSTWYADLDGDSWGDESSTAEACTAPGGYVEVSGDCDDTDAAVYPGADEYCNGTDDDCDGEVDESGALDEETWYRDGDGDEAGNRDVSTTACEQPSGYVSNARDCDDTDAAVYPGADEYCNGTDDDCDGEVDESGALDEETWYRDADSDGFGDASEAQDACDMPDGYTDNDRDCDDSDSSITDECWDTGHEGFRDGTYFGTIEVEVVIAGFLSDTCAGDMTIYVDEYGDPQISGEGSCSFSGILSDAGTQTGELDGSITSDPDCEGEISVGAFASDWSGSFTDDDTIEGEFSGSTTYSGWPVDYTGYFTGER